VILTVKSAEEILALVAERFKIFEIEKDDPVWCEIESNLMNLKR